MMKTSTPAMIENHRKRIAELRQQRDRLRCELYNACDQLGLDKSLFAPLPTEDKLSYALSSTSEFASDPDKFSLLRSPQHTPSINGNCTSHSFFFEFTVKPLISGHAL